MRVIPVILLSLVTACGAALPDLVASPTQPLSTLDLRGQYEIGVEGTIATLPLAGARVELIGVGLVTHTDTNGEFGFLGIPAEALSNRLEFLVFDAQGLESAPPIGRFIEEISSTAVGSVTFTTKVVNPRGAITGRVDLVGDDNDGGVLVYAEGLPGVDDLTGPDGSFVLLGVPAGSVQIRSNRDGFLPTPDVINFEAQAYLRLPVQEPILLNPVPGEQATAATGGRVLTDDGQIPEGTEVWAIPQISGDVDQEMVRMPVAADGRFGAALLFNEPHQFVLKSEGRLTTARRLQVQPGRQDIVLVGLPLGESGEDRDGDGRIGDEDTDDLDPHTWADLDGDGIGDIHDWDDDGDSIADMEELCPGRDNSTSNPQSSSFGSTGTPVLETGGPEQEIDEGFWGQEGSSVESPNEQVRVAFEALIAERYAVFGTRVLHGPYLVKTSELGDFEFRDYGYLGASDDRVELVAMTIRGCEEWADPDCSAPFGQFNVSAFAPGFTQETARLQPAGRGRLKMVIPFTLDSPSLVWVWLPAGAAITPLCGNGQLDWGEICDDGNPQEDDDCTSACLPPVCGDGIMQPGREEGCDDGNGNSRDGCTNQCQVARCGDGILRSDVDAGSPGYEECDDGNNQSGDGCDATCIAELEPECVDNDGDGFGEGCPNGPDCNDTNPVVTADCDCGNGVIEEDEFCDDGNTRGEDGCNTDCSGPSLIPLAVGGEYSCRIGNGSQPDSLSCWGRLFDGMPNVDIDPVVRSQDPVYQVALGTGHGCVIKAAADQRGHVFCFGTNDDRQLGSSAPPGTDLWGPLMLQDIEAPLVAMKIAAGDRHTCALTSTGSVYCWGANGVGQAGQFDAQDAPVGQTVYEPTRVPLSHEAVDIALGFRHSCAKLSSGGMECWGYAATNALGRWDGGDDPCAGSQSQSVGAVMGLHEATIHSLSAGMDTTCALMTDGELYCWGDNRLGQLGQGDANWCSTNPQPRRVQPNLNPEVIARFTRVSAGNAVTCALGFIEGGVEETGWCWGSNNRGRLGLGNMDPDHVQWIPGQIGPDPLSSPSFIANGVGDHACTLAAGETLCWGAGDSYQLGDCSTGDVYSPVPVREACGL